MFRADPEYVKKYSDLLAKIEKEDPDESGLIRNLKETINDLEIMYIGQ